ncbi:hypothetical protein [Silvimonas amylolytica]|uniref:Uncharacterized protein n=1 Tax=Silvimonas amylolytica TaxID=449663 RepID=A0ABQ2PP79_9NEIS|nr:hypothetical protein [Silvimonas amylolytica]GGP27128.1 hypothetical protein GCM10010971_29470 [Silvimonas amylolytica]
MVLPGKNTHVFYVHSPITWSLAQAIIARLDRADVRLIGARGMAGPEMDLVVEDDGGLSIEQTCAYLQQLLGVCQPGRGLVLYVPHTVFLAGQLLRHSARVQQIYYLEEGLTSTQPARLANIPPLLADAAPLLHALQQHGLLDALQLDPSDVLQLPHTPSIAFDWHNTRYGGRFACSADAFSGMPGVTLLDLPRHPHLQAAQLVSFASVLNRFAPGTASQGQLEARCAQLLSMAETLDAHHDTHQALLFRLHPRDTHGLPRWFYDAWQRYARTYPCWCEVHGLDALAEPALLNFARYHVVGQSAQSKYVTAWWGATRLTQPYPAF